MRIQLAAAVALAPLMMASGAAAQTVINSERTTPITTSTANNGAADSIEIANGGIIRLATGTAVTIDSANNLTIAGGGRIAMDSAADGATGVLIQPGVTSTVNLGGAITITDNFTPTDTDSDGDLDGDYVTGTGRYGVRVTGPGTATASIIHGGGGLISVDGNQSAGISIESDLNADVVQLGTITVTGTDSYGMRITGNVVGDIISHGATTVTGQGATALSIEGDVDGAFVLGSTVGATGYRYTGTLSPAQIAALDADDLLIGGSAVSISGDISGGVLFDRAPVNDPDDTDDDDDGILDVDDPDDDNDGINDINERTANVVAAGSAPAVVFGSTTDTVTIGAVGTGDEGYGFINRGTIVGTGIYVDIPTTGVQIGVDGGQTATISGGIRNEGEIRSVAGNADTTALRVQSTGVVDRLDNMNVIGASAGGDGAFDVVAVDVQAGGFLGALTNRLEISALLYGETADVYAIRDASGSLSNILNTGSITAIIVADDDANDTDDANTNPADEVVTGRAVAIDVSANTSGVTLIQDGLNDGDDGDDGRADPDVDGDGVDDGDEPTIRGDVLLGSGGDAVEIRNGTLTGDIDFGAGADSFLVDGGAVVTGALSDADGLLDINVNDGLLDARQTSALTVSGLTIGAEGDLIVTIDPTNSATGGFNVNGTATIVDGAGLGARFVSLVDDPTRFVIVQATDLNAGNLDQSRLQANSPYMFVVSAGVDDTLNQIYIDARQRTSAEYGFIASETATYGAFYEALTTDQELLNAFLSQTGRDGFFDLYEQLLPEHSGGALVSLATGVDAVTRAMSGRGHVAGQGETSAWLQEINFYADKDRGEAYGFRSEGFGLAGGFERGTNVGAFGLSFALTSSDLEDPESEAEELLSAQLLEFGLYWRAQGVRWNVWARGAAGYATFDSVRQLVATGINRRNESSWNGTSLAFAAGASYDYQTGRWSVRPEATIEYFRLSEDAHSESGGGAGFDLDYEDREGHILSSTIAVNLGAAFGENRWLRPELRLGYRQIISHDPGATVASFLSTGTPFTLNGDSLEGGGPIIGFRLNLGNELGFLALEADAEMLNDYVRYALLLRASFKF